MGRLSPIVLGLALLAPTLLLGVPPAAASNVEIVATLPAPLVGASAAAVGDDLYVFGGRLADGSYSDAILRVRTTTQEVVQVGTLPSARASSGAVAMDGKLYVFGGAGLVERDVNGDGTNETVPKALDEIVRFDPATGDATVLPERLPRPAWGVSAASWRSEAFVMGGYQFDLDSTTPSQRLDQVVLFRLDIGYTVDLSPLPHPVQDAAAVVIDGTAYLFGGLADHDEQAHPCPTRQFTDPYTGETREQQPLACRSDAVVAYDVEAGMSRGTVTHLPERLQFASASVVGGIAMVAGGMTEDYVATDAILRFDPHADHVAREALTLPTAVYGAAAAAPHDADLYVMGGRTGNYSELTDAVVRVDPKTPEGVPSAPTAFQAVRDGAEVVLSWQPPADAGDSPVESYHLTYVGEDGVARHLAKTTELSFQWSAGAFNEAIVYRVQAVNQQGSGALAYAKLPGVGTPSAPGDLTATGEGTVPGTLERVRLEWSPPEQTHGLDVVAYRIYRVEGDSSDFELMAEVAGDRLSHVDDAPPLAGPVRYLVAAVTLAGEGALSDEARVDPAADALAALVETLPSA